MPKSTSPAELLDSLISRSEIRAAARSTRFVRRQRKVDPVAFLLTVVFGMSVRWTQSLAGLRRILALETQSLLARSAFWSRFTPAFEEFVTWFLDRLRGAPPLVRPGGLIGEFIDVVVVDSTVMKVRDALARIWPGTRAHTAAAAVKVHTWIRAVTGDLRQYKITGEKYPDCRWLRVDHCHRGILFLFDRAYSSASLWYRIHHVGAHFITRLPASHNAIVISTNRAHRGRARSILGNR